MRKSDSNQGRLGAGAGTGEQKIRPSRNKLDLDIVGIRSGMAESEAEGAIKIHNGEMKIFKKSSTLRGIPDTEFTAQIVGLSGASGGEGGTEIILVSFLLPPYTTVVGEIQRTLFFKRSELPTLENIETSLFKKYGQPNRERKMGGSNQYEWVYYDNGKLMKSPRDFKVCRANAKHLNFGKGVESEVLNPSTRYSDKHDICGLSIGARIRKGGDGLALAVSIKLRDYRLLVQGSKKTQELIQNHKEQERKTKLKSAEKRGSPKF